MRKSNRPWVAAVSAVAAGSLLLGGCAAGSADSDGGDAADVSDELVVALAGDIDNFDPHTNQLIIYEYAIRELVFSSLVDYDVDLNLQGDLATEFEANEDATEFTFTLDAHEDLPSGTELTNIATIVFDLGESIDTNQVDPHDKSQGTDPTMALASFLSGLSSIVARNVESFDSAVISVGHIAFLNREYIKGKFKRKRK